MAELTPMMKQYLKVKERCPDCILFFRLGDFYEMFFEDAKTASKVLELVLTGRDCGLEERAPMCGVPYHAALSYISRLISAGYKVAVCEQMEDPATAKGIVERDIVRIYTPGTVTEDQMLDQKLNNYILSIYEFKGIYGLAAADLSTGEMHCTSLTIGSTFQHLANEIARFAPKEVILNDTAVSRVRLEEILHTISGAYVTMLPEAEYDYERASGSLLPLMGQKQGAEKEFLKQEPAVRAAGALISYIANTQKADLDGIIQAEFYQVEEYMVIDASSRRNLEITETMRDKGKRGSLLWVLDRTVTSMGGRMLRKWLEQPLIDVDAINLRLDGVEELKSLFMVRSELRELLGGVYDMERLAGKISLGTANARDLVSLRQSLGKLPYVKALLQNCTSPILCEETEQIDELQDICELLERAIVEDPPLALKEGGIIKDGYQEEIDSCRSAARDGKGWLASLEAKEREETGIKNLKIGYNRVFGYYIEITKSYLNLVPARYVRKQTLTNNERYITDELKKMEDTILGAEERLIRLEFEHFTRIREYVASHAERLRATAAAIAKLDALSAYAEVSDRENYCRPRVNQGTEIILKDSRHPVVERMLDSGAFVPNDVYTNMDEDMLLVITGPNMAGKSTYMRQVALIVLMAQAGCFIPAAEGEIGIVDKLFTRVGASDDLASGQSTFMVEMGEVANILANATARSLLILDEIGRGTSTFDGLSIAWAVLEYIVDHIKSRTLFATHYHELTELEGRIPGVKNYCVSVNRKGDDIIFLRKMKRGGADGSYGIAVAALAGIPKSVTLRAKEILAQLEEQDISRSEVKATRKRGGQVSENQLDLFAFTSNTVMHDEIIEELKAMNVQELTPIEAMNALYRLQQKAEKRI